MQKSTAMGVIFNSHLLVFQQKRLALASCCAACCVLQKYHRKQDLARASSCWRQVAMVSRACRLSCSSVMDASISRARRRSCSCASTSACRAQNR